MEVQHHLIIHLINMISGKNQNVVRIVLLHIVHILENGICSSCIPLTVRTLFVWRQYRHSSFIFIQIPRDSNSNMCVQTQWLILCQYTDRINTRINTIAQREIDDTIFSTKSNCRFGNLSSKYAKSAALPARKEHGNHFFLNHAITSCLL